MSLFKDFTYCVRISEFYPETEEKKVKFVTKVNFSDKTYEMHTFEEIANNRNLEIQKFELNRAVELMNWIFCNGKASSIAPYFDN